MKTKKILILVFIAAVISFTANANATVVLGSYQGAIFETGEHEGVVAECNATIITTMEDPASYEGAKKSTREHIPLGQKRNMDREVTRMPDTPTFVYTKELVCGKEEDGDHYVIIRVTANKMVYNPKFIEVKQKNEKAYSLRFLCIDDPTLVP